MPSTRLETICWASIHWPSRHPPTGPLPWVILDLYGLPESYIGQFGTDLLKVDATGIRTVIDTAFPSPENVDIVLIGDAAQIGEAASKWGPVTKMSLSAPYFAAASTTR